MSLPKDPKDHPFLVPEISLHISRFVRVEDAIICAQVCKDWIDPFTTIVWSTVNFSVHKQFVNLDPATVKKHAHRILEIKDIAKVHELVVLHSSKFRRLQRLGISMQPTPRFQAYLLDFLLQNTANLTQMKLWADETAMWFNATFFPIQALCPSFGGQASLKLRLLTIHNVALTRDAFSFTLRMCPALETLEILHSVIFCTLCTEPYRHEGITHLRTSLPQLFAPDQDPSGELIRPSLLAHFPGLQTLKILGALQSPIPNIQTMKEDFAQHCPLLKNVRIKSETEIAGTLFKETFQSLTNISVFSLSEDIIVGILAHQDTLLTLDTSAQYPDYCEQDTVPQLPESSSVPIWKVLLIPQVCSRLKIINLPETEIDMDAIEKRPWLCTDLRILNIRIRGLDTKEKIIQALGLWTTIRKRSKNSDLQSSSSSGNFEVDIQANENSIESRVARHLLRFEKLYKVEYA
ncbi:hypothetical protein BGZ65_001458 [Modicella reniformis]|uniref:F-box domain-containing protein n=1 Tax=Modicella reniformis TaxID=1440133 RepID=A0A9P6SPW0_9FUNG|nr:hypothetical protein BGZ65_001458 [Modicella reniformis]